MTDMLHFSVAPINPEQPVLSIVTGTLNRPESLARLITSVLKRTRVPYELLIADASDSPFDAPTGVRIFHESPRLGHTKGYNHIFRMCRGEFVIWLNDDAEVLPGYDVAGIDLLRQHSADIGLGAYYYKEDGRFHVNVLYQMVFANFGIIPRALGDKIGWFDEDLYMYGADNSLTFRVLLAGYGIATVPGANIIHHSEKDEIRIENDLGRPTASDILQRKYGPLKREMQDVYNRTRHLVGPRYITVV